MFCKFECVLQNILDTRKPTYCILATLRRSHCYEHATKTTNILKYISIFIGLPLESCFKSMRTVCIYAVLSQVFANNAELRTGWRYRTPSVSLAFVNN